MGRAEHRLGFPTPGEEIQALPSVPSTGSSCGATRLVQEVEASTSWC